MNNFYLVGMPGCGKSTIGRSVSRELNMEFVDLDLYIEKKTKKSIDELFGVGEEHFRKIETDCLKEIANANKYLVATGGGVVEKNENIDIMRKSGIVIFIDVSCRNILDKCSLDGRPLLKDKNRIFELYDRRISLYRKSADYTVDNGGLLSTACEKIIHLIKQRMK